MLNLIIGQNRSVGPQQRNDGEKNWEERENWGDLQYSQLPYILLSIIAIPKRFI